MPKIYLSPSLQEYNPYTGGGNEEYYMNLVADAMEPYLRASGIEFSRNKPDMTLSQAIADSNKGDYDLHLAIHSNASPPATAGQNTGAAIYYYPTSTKGKQFTNSLAEVRRTKAPTALVEVAYHDNPTDAKWIRDNINNIARSLSQSVAQYLGVPFVEP